MSSLVVMCNVFCASMMGIVVVGLPGYMSGWTFKLLKVVAMCICPAALLVRIMCFVMPWMLCCPMYMPVRALGPNE